MRHTSRYSHVVRRLQATAIPSRGHPAAIQRKQFIALIKKRSKSPGPRGNVRFTRSRGGVLCLQTLMFDDARQWRWLCNPRKTGRPNLEVAMGKHMISGIQGCPTPWTGPPASRGGDAQALYPEVKAGEIPVFDRGNMLRGEDCPDCLEHCRDWRSVAKVDPLLLWDGSYDTLPPHFYAPSGTTFTNMNELADFLKMVPVTRSIDHAEINIVPPVTGAHRWRRDKRGSKTRADCPGGPRTRNSMLRSSITSSAGTRDCHQLPSSGGTGSTISAQMLIVHAIVKAFFYIRRSMERRPLDLIIILDEIRNELKN